MASIVLSFVGQQDPFAKTDSEGSIVSLVRHLVATGKTVKRVFLLYTEKTERNAIDTREWLRSEISTLSDDTIELLPVSQAFSDDPINQLLAVQEARRAIEAAQVDQTQSDTLEFNSSSATPAMKSCWSILQATGYANRSHVWQIRNPQEMLLGQDRVFRNDVNALKHEFDIQVIQRQVQDYNYSGALITLDASQIDSPVVRAMLEYGYYRTAMDFDQAFSCLNAVKPSIAPQWEQEIATLRQKDGRALLQEAYFNALIRLKNRKYADFLVGLFKLQEQILYFLVRQRLGLAVSGDPTWRAQSWRVIQQAEQGKLYQFLEAYRLPGGDRLELNRISRYTLQAIVEYYPQSKPALPLIQELNQYCNLRNESVHGFVGVSQIGDEAKLVTTLRQLMKQVTGIPEVNPFDRLNQQINELLDRSTRV